MSKGLIRSRIRHKSLIRISVLTSLYRCEEYLVRYFKNVLNISNLEECEFIFIHNDPTALEKEIIFNYLSNQPQINYIYIPVAREKLYKSWNRGIKAANGDFIAVWNADDIRFKDSLYVQAEKLSENTSNGLVYGDKFISAFIDDPMPKLTKSKNVSENPLKMFQDGSLIMWRKSCHKSIGLFDEQFTSLGDQDIWYRIALLYNIVKVNQPIGVFLNEAGKGISKRSKISGIEKIIIGARYGFFTTSVNPFGLYSAISRYSFKKIHFEDGFIKTKIFRYNSVKIYGHSIKIFLLSIAFALKRKIA